MDCVLILMQVRRYLVKITLRMQYNILHIYYMLCPPRIFIEMKVSPEPETSSISLFDNNFASRALLLNQVKEDFNFDVFHFYTISAQIE